MTGEMFKPYVEQVLAPELRLGDVIVLDNLASGDPLYALRAAKRIERGVSPNHAANSRPERK